MTRTEPQQCRQGAEAASVRSGKRRLAAMLLLALLVLATAAVVFWRSNRVYFMSMDDPIWFNRAKRLPWHCREAKDYKAAIDIPAANRWVYGAAIRVTGVDKYSARVGYEEPVVLNDNEAASAHLWILPMPVLHVLRAVNALVYALFLAVLWRVAHVGLRWWWLALLPVVPMVVSPSMLMVSHRLAPDPFLALGLAATLLVWMRFHVSGRGVSWKSVLWVGVAAGLATSTKHNGGLALLAFACYLALHAKGRERLTKPVAACAIAFAAFCLLNPVMLISGRAPWTVLADVFARRGEVFGQVSTRFGPYGRWEIVTRGLPLWELTPLMVAAQVVALKRFRWFEPVAWWGAFLVAGTIFVVNMPSHWYVAPAQVGLYFPSILAAAAVAASFLSERLVIRGKRAFSAEHLTSR